jgi:RNA-directed DNA polymerase
VEERDERGNRRMTGGKKSKQGTPQGGVVSPLLANLYINRLLRHWRKTGAYERLGRIISYADDFVIVCASRRQAEESLSLVSRWLEKLGLTIHPTKTRLCHAREEPFDFLGYTFGPARHWQTGKRFISAQPSKKAQKRVKEKINTLLFRGNPRPWPELRDRLNRLLSGWAEYFSFGFTGQADDAIAWHVKDRVRRFLCRRHKLRVSGTSRFGHAEVHGEMGVVDIHQRRLRKACACPLVKLVGEPDAGDPHVRFDERRRETEPRPRLRHRHQRKRRQQLLPRPTATAPAADSTLFWEFRTAAEKLKAGDPDPHFPRGCFPPVLPFVYG